MLCLAFFTWDDQKSSWTTIATGWDAHHSYLVSIIYATLGGKLIEVTHNQSLLHSQAYDSGLNCVVADIYLRLNKSRFQIIWISVLALAITMPLGYCGNTLISYWRINENTYNPSRKRSWAQVLVHGYSNFLSLFARKHSLSVLLRSGP